MQRGGGRSHDRAATGAGRDASGCETLGFPSGVGGRFSRRSSPQAVRTCYSSCEVTCQLACEVSSARNQTLLRLLEDVTPAGEKQAICENRGSGVGAMLAALRDAGLPRPVFDNRIASFRVTFLNSPRIAPDLARTRQRADRRDEILRVLRGQTDLSRSEISQRVALSNAATRRWLSILRDEGLIVTTDTKARSRNTRYRLAR
jgi:predicted HTH transcriptional regulator